MRQKLFLISVLFLCSAFSRSTTFDDRDSCEKSKGIWREFGDDCADYCEARLDEFAICTNVLNFGCACSKSQCWNDEKKSCVAVNEYKKTFDIRKAEERRIANEAKKQREQEAKINRDSILNNLKDQTNALTNTVTPINPAPTAEPIPDSTSTPTTPTPTNDDKSSQPNPESTNPPLVPPFFLQKEEELRKKVEEEKKKSEQESQLPGVPGLPVIPLPQ